MDGEVIFKEKNTGLNSRTSATYCPDFRKNILSVKKLQLAGYMVSFEDTKATIGDKQTGKIAFVCHKGTKIGDPLASHATDESREWKVFNRRSRQERGICEEK